MEDATIGAITTRKRKDDSASRADRVCVAAYDLDPQAGRPDPGLRTAWHRLVRAPGLWTRRGAHPLTRPAHKRALVFGASGPLPGL